MEGEDGGEAACVATHDHEGLSDESEPGTASAPDDSDEEWEVESAVSASSEGSGGSSSAATVNWSGDEMRLKVVALVDADVCGAECLQGKEGKLQEFLLSHAQLTKDGRRVSLLTALAVLKEADVAERHRGHGIRERYAYFLPMVGRVCRESFCGAYSVSSATVKRLRRQIKRGSFAPHAHGGVKNHNAAVLDVDWLVGWFEEFAARVGEAVPVRVRRQSTIDGQAKRFYSPVDYILIPAYFTWEKIYEEMLTYIAEKSLSIREPAPSTMRRLMKERCPTIRIRSARSNVCDVCAIYSSSMKGTPSSDLTEAFGKHTTAARRMRVEYQNDLANASDSVAVLIIDFSQNLTLPSVATTPSQWYFLSLWSVNMFGIYFANDSIQYNYLYEEGTAGKGSDEVISMLHHFIKAVLLPRGFTELIVYADNCAGQNKNNFVVKFLLALTHMGDFESVALKFFVKGHTKNAVDRGFGHVRKKLARIDVYTMGQLVDLVDSAATSSATVHLTPDMNAFKNYKLVLSDAYKNIPAITKYQVFLMADSAPGTVRCYADPDQAPVVCDLRRQYDGITTDDARVRTMFMMHLEPLPLTKPNAEKVITMHYKVRQYVPEEFQDDVLYAAPSAQQETMARTTKEARGAARKAAKQAVSIASNDDALPCDNREATATAPALCSPAAGKDPRTPKRAKNDK